MSIPPTRRAAVARLVTFACALTLTVPLAVGCGSGEVQHDPMAAYSPEGLAEELAFRAKPVISKRRAPAPKAQSKGAAAAEDAVRNQTEATKKDLSEQTLDDVVDDVMAKARTIPNTTPEQARAKLAEALRARTDLDASEKATLLKVIEPGSGS